MFGYTIISKKRLKDLEDTEQRYYRLYHYHYWFSGWPNIFSLLQKFVIGKVNNVTVSDIRSEFAKTMGTDVYGKRIKNPQGRRK